MVIFLSLLAVVGYLLIGCTVVAVCEATNYMRGKEPPTKTGLGDTTGPGAVFLAIGWPIAVAIVIVAVAVLGPFWLFKVFTEKLTRRLNPNFKNWHRVNIE